MSYPSHMIVIVMIVLIRYSVAFLLCKRAVWIMSAVFIVIYYDIHYTPNNRECEKSKLIINILIHILRITLEVLYYCCPLSFFSYTFVLLISLINYLHVAIKTEME